MNFTQQQIDSVCTNIGKVLSMIYSRRYGADIKVTCIPKEGEKNDEK